MFIAQAWFQGMIPVSLGETDLSNKRVSIEVQCDHT